MKITLVALYNLHSYAIRILHSILRNAGHNVSSIYFYEYYDQQEPTESDIQNLIDVIKDEKPDIVGFTILSPFFPLFKKLSELIQKEINTFILIGGHHANVAPEDCWLYADAICMGDGETALLEFINNFPDPVPGILTAPPFKINSSLTHNLDSVPFRAYLQDGSQKYLKSSLDYDSVQKMNVLTSRGCYFDCSFCYNHVMKRLTGNKHYYRRRSVDNVIAELKELERLFPNLNNIVFSDNVFAGYATKTCYNWIDEFCEKYIKYINKPFRCFSHFSGITSKMLKKLKSAGCYMMTMGFQSGSERIRNEYLNKHETNKQIIEATKKIAQSSIIGRYDRIRNIPYETDADRKENDDLIAQFQKPFILREFILLNHPGTALTKRMLKDGMITNNQIEGVCATAYKKTVKIIKYE